jgi:hypothetical protein
VTDLGAQTGWAFYFDPVRGFVYVRMWGLLTVGLFVATKVALVAHSQFDPDLAVILDLRQTDLSRLQSREIEVLAGRTTAFDSPRRALVVNDDQQFDVGRLYGTERALAGGLEAIRVVYTVPEALEWLGCARGAIPDSLEGTQLA